MTNEVVDVGETDSGLSRKAETAVSNTVTIYVSLLDEGVSVWRPVQAEHLHDNVYRIAVQPYTRANELWQFDPGDIVLCESVESTDGPIVAATRRAT